MLQVRRHTYRHEAGWLLSGKDAHGRHISCFFTDEATARRERIAKTNDPNHEISFKGDA